MNMIQNDMNTNVNQIFFKVSQLMFQAFNNINQIIINMNQLIANMNQINKLVNVNSFQANEELNKINIMMKNINDLCVPKKSKINIIFETKGGDKKPGNVQCYANEKLSDIIDKYRTQYGDTKSTHFIFNSRQLRLDKTAEEEGIKNGSKILTIDGNDIQGGHQNSYFVK